MTIINICFSSDNNYAKHMAVAMISILKNSKSEDSYNFYILDGGISPKNKTKINELLKIRSFNIEYLNVNSDDFKDCPMTGYVKYITLPTYYRFKIASLLPNIDKILYLDCDIIVDSDISELYNYNIEQYYIGAIPEVFNQDHKRRLDIEGNAYYCNAGVLLINSKKWREDNIEGKLFEYAKKPQREIIFQDQDVLNEVLKYKIKYIPLKWNVQHDSIFSSNSYIYHSQEREESLKNPSLVHFSHKYKPWNYKCYNKFKNLYYLYLKQSPWKYDLGYIYFRKFIRELSHLVYYKKREENNVKIKILGICVYKRIKDELVSKKYLCGIKYCEDINLYNIDQKINIINDLLNEISAEGKYCYEKLKYSVDNSLSIYELHQKVFPKYKNINQGKDVILIATGPSLKNFKLINDAIYLGVNKAFQYDKVKFDYLFLQDYSGATKTYIDDFCKYDAKIFLGHLNYNLEPQCIIPDKYSLYPNVERYYNIHPSYQQYFTYDIATQPLGDAYSIAFPAMQFILWTNPKRIYLVGCDCNMSGYHDSADKNNLAVNEVIDGWKRMKEFANTYYPDTEIISINPVGLKGVFKDEYQERINGK